LLLAFLDVIRRALTMDRTDAGLQFLGLLDEAPRVGRKQEQD
jgi:hypothetical protein